MAISSTFTTGQVFTAADANLMANSGLTYITSGALSGTSTNFVGCFSSTYENYRIVFSSVQWSGAGDIYWNLLSGTTPETTANYSWAFLGYRIDAVTANSNGSGITTGYTGMSQSGVNNVPFGSCSLDIYSPNLAQRTLITATSISYQTNFLSRTGMGLHNLTTSYNGIQFNTGGGANMGGTVTIYGYRKP